MRARLQVVIESGAAAPVTTELALIERSGLSADTVGLHLAEAKSLLGGLQQALVDAQVTEAMDAARVCPKCRAELHCKGHHELVYRTVFGQLTLPSPRLYRCACGSDATAAVEPRSFSPLAEVLPERTSPELQYLETKFAALMSYGLTLKVLDEFLPVDHPLAGTSIRRTLDRVGERIEAKLPPTPEPRKTASAAAADIPAPPVVKAIGIDGGYVHNHIAPSPQEGWFEVIVGKSNREGGAGRSFAYVNRLEPKPWERMQRFLKEEGVQIDDPVVFLSDGGDTVRNAQFGFGEHREYVLDGFQVGMRFQNLTQLAKGLAEADDRPKREAILKDIEGAKWHLWHGCPHRAIQRLEHLNMDVDAMPDSPAKTKLAAKLDECLSYVQNNYSYIVNYGDRFRHGEPIASSFAESAINQVVAKRFVKKQQMRWSDQHADRLLQARTAVLNGELRDHFETWYPGIAANDSVSAMEAA